MLGVPGTVISTTRARTAPASRRVGACGWRMKKILMKKKKAKKTKNDFQHSQDRTKRTSTLRVFQTNTAWAAPLTEE